VSTYEFDTGGVERLVGQLKAVGGATGDVPTQQASGELLQAPGGGGSMPGCVIVQNNIENIDDFGTPHYLTWDTIWDDVVDQNELPDFPDGMGLSGIPSDTITTTEAGVWAFSLDSLLIPADATWSGLMIFGNFTSPPARQTIFAQDSDNNARAFMAALTVNLPVGAGFSLGFNTEVAATVSPLNVTQVAVAIVRLA
jgi:hypothetical protein